MKLYNSVGPNPRMVRLYLAEKGIELELVQVDIIAGESRQPDYLAKNYVGHTPCLELDDGSHIAETVVICEYLEELHPEPVLIGSTPRERAETRLWTRRVGQQIVDPLVAAFRSAEGLPMFKDRMRTYPQAADDLKAATLEGLQALDAQIAGREFIAGDRFSLADVQLFPFLEFRGQIGQPLEPELSNLNAWYERVAARPSVTASQ